VSAGAWGNNLTGSVDLTGISAFTDAEALAAFGVTADKLFNLTLVDTATGRRERIQNVTVAESLRRVDRVLMLESQLMRVQTTDGVTPNLPTSGIPGATPQDKPVAATGGDDGQNLDWTSALGSQDKKTGMYLLENADIFNLMCIPPDVRDQDVPTTVWGDALTYCVKRRAMLIVDPPNSWKAKTPDPLDLDFTGTAARNAAVFFPRVLEADPLRKGQIDAFVPCGIMAGIMARTDADRGVWKAPAGLDSGLANIQGLTIRLTDGDSGTLNPLGVNCLRVMPAAGAVVWGSRTMRGADRLSDDYKYIPVRRTALFIEESLFRGTQWAVFEPNDEPLWSQIRLNVGAFMQSLFRQGAFAGQTPRDAYFVKCDKETTTQDDVNRGVVNVRVGFAPLKPAEFVIIQLQQMAGQLAA
jgi:phage tail sheath protein FI